MSSLAVFGQVSDRCGHFSTILPFRQATAESEREREESVMKANLSPPRQDLRRHAEAQLRKKRVSSVLPRKGTDKHRLLHELQVHQIELEMQNEELQQERTRMEAMLAQYTDLYDFAPTGYLTLNREGTIQQLNFAGARLLGGERSRVMKRRLAAFVALHDRRRFHDFIEEVFASKDKASCEVTLRQESARPMLVQIEGVHSVTQRECRLVILDVSEQKLNEQKRGQLAAIVESSSDAIISATREGIVTSWNTAAERLCGFTAGEIIGRPIAVIVPPERRAELPGLYERIQHGESVDAYETMRMRKDGRTFPAEVTVFPIRDMTGDITGISSILRDISPRKNLERQLVESAERERRDLGHELHDGLGQHLHALHFLATLLLKDLKKENSSSTPAAARLSTLLQEAAALTRDVARGLQPVRPVPEGLMTALHKLTARTQTLYNLGCDLDCRIPVLVNSTGVATHLFRIAQEAVNNAVKHARAKRIRLTLHEEERQIILTIKDDGIGIRTPRRKRDGMGLHVMRHRANIMGGVLNLQRSARGGTEVICAVPCVGDVGSEAATPGANP